MAHGDFHSVEEKLLSRYQLTTQFGVNNLFRDIHDLREKRFVGTDTSFLSCVLLDFERILERTPLTEKQREALYYHYEKDLTQKEVAEIMNITQQGVSKHIDNAIAKIVVFAKEEENHGKTL